MKSRLILSGLLIAVSLSLVDCGWSEVISLKGESIEVAAALSGDQVDLKGAIKIVNKGDETAFQVFPEFTIGNWKWAGEAKDLDNGQANSWTYENSVPVSLLTCNEDLSCAGASLPGQGLYPVFIRQHYQDGNKYPFSAPDLRTVVVGKLEEHEVAGLRSPNLSAKLEFGKPGQEFSGILSLYNGSDSSLEIAVTIFTSREIQVRTAPTIIKLPPASEKTLEVKLRNFSGLEGSRYVVFAVLQWEQKGFRNTHWTRGMVTLAKPPSKLLFVAIGAAVVVLTLFGAWLLFFRKV